MTPAHVKQPRYSRVQIILNALMEGFRMLKIVFATTTDKLDFFSNVSEIPKKWSYRYLKSIFHHGC